MSGVAAPCEFFEWLDHRSFGDEWEDLDDLRKMATPLIVNTVGWVMFEDDKSLLVVPTILFEDTATTFGLGSILILKACITKRCEAKI